MTAQAHVYTDEQLRAAWLACKRCTWPPTFEEAMADALCARLVRLRAWLHTHPGRTREVPLSSFVARGPAPPRPHFTAPPGWVDHKRAAAGDRDD